MNQKQLLAMVDHTLLAQTATWADIKKICDEGLEFQTASVCIPPVFVRQAADYVEGKLPICTVIGFPNGYMDPAVKLFETKTALTAGAKEIDMVIHIGGLKEGRHEAILNEMKALKEACGQNILKVIIETCMLTDDEKKKMCELVTEAGADFIKTSTGFGGAGATFADVELFAKYVGPQVRIKAAGGIKSFEDADKFVALGASRLGTSRLVAIKKQEASEPGTY